MGKVEGGGDLILKVIAHPFWKEETMHIKYWLDSSHRSRQPRSGRATWGNASVRARLRCQHGGGSGGKEDSCYWNVLGRQGN